MNESEPSSAISLNIQVTFSIREEKCLTNCIWGFIKFAMFEEQIKMFDENKQQLDLPFFATHTEFVGNSS